MISGWQVAGELKVDAGTATIPLIALTAHSMAGDRERALVAGCDEYDTKPVEFDRLLTNIRGLLAELAD